MKCKFLIVLLFLSFLSYPLTILLVYSTPFTVDYSTETQVIVWKESLPYYLFKIGYRKLWSYHPVNWTVRDTSFNITFEWSIIE